MVPCGTWVTQAAQHTRRQASVLSARCATARAPQAEPSLEPNALGRAALDLGYTGSPAVRAAAVAAAGVRVTPSPHLYLLHALWKAASWRPAPRHPAASPSLALGTARRGFRMLGVLGFQGFPPSPARAPHLRDEVVWDDADDVQHKPRAHVVARDAHAVRHQLPLAVVVRRPAAVQAGEYRRGVYRRGMSGTTGVRVRGCAQQPAHEGSCPRTGRQGR